MEPIKVGVAALNQTPVDWRGNISNIRTAIEQARAEEVSLLCLPELAITAYGCEDAFLSSDVHRRAFESLLELEPLTENMIVAVGLPVAYQGAVYDCAALLCDGELRGLVAQRYLALEGVHYEPRWFRPWTVGRRGSVQIAGRSVPIGDYLFDCGGLRIGFEICEDAWASSRPGSALADEGVDIILNPSGSHFAFGKDEIRQRFVLEGSRAFGVIYLYANMLGNEAGRIIYDGTSFVASAGELVTTGKRFSFEQVVLTTAVVDVEKNRLQRARRAISEPSEKAAQPTYEVLAGAFDWTDERGAQLSVTKPLSDIATASKYEEFASAVALGLFDYLRKSRSRGFVISLSGGADSAATACLCALMVRYGVAELGLERFKGLLSYMPEIGKLKDEAALRKFLITCVYQATKNSSETTLRAAQELALALDATFYQTDVESIVESYIGLVTEMTGEKLNWEKHDIPLQNIQARARGPLVWLIANLRGALLLATSNRSEAAVGYTTMDGDTCGGLSPIAGIDKAFLRSWLKWLEKTGPSAWGKLPVLKHVTSQEPTAELRPRDRNQTDEGDLMPYDVLDSIERLAIRDKKSPKQCLQALRTEFSSVSEQECIAWVKKFFTLWSQNQWKRERYAPSFHLDDENLDPKTWCRFPILSGGYRTELEELS